MTPAGALSLSTAMAASTLGSDQSLVQAQRIAQAAKNRWCRGERPDVAGVLADHPELKRYKSIALDLACAEYQFRLKEGESLAPDEFARRFPSLRRSLCLLIEVQRLLEQDPRLRDLQEDLLWPEPGESFLGFSLIAELGQGTFGRVFLASEPALGGRLVALKVAAQGGQEAEMLGKLRHPNIMPVYSVQEDQATGLTAVCMPYLGQATFRDILDSAFAGPAAPTDSRAILQTLETCGEMPVPAEKPRLEGILRRGSYVDVVLHFAAQLADALAYTHAQGICHRDLKPSNVLVSFDGRPLLLDFNLSFDADLNVQRVGGTLPYMAPEQLQLLIHEHGEHASRPDPRSDLFSLGVILYELLCGSLPFGDIPWDGRVEEISRHLLREQKKGPRPLRARNNRVDKRLECLIRQCLEFDADKRPETAAVLAATVRRQLTPLRRGKRWARNHRRFVSVCLALFSVLVLAVVSFFALRDPYSVREFKRGQQYTQAGNYELAVERFDQAIRANRADLDAVFARGVAYKKMGDFREAFHDFQRLTLERPTAEAWVNHGFCLGKLRFFESAIASYRMALDLGYRSAAVFNNIGFSHVQLARHEEAEPYLREALALDERLESAHHMLLVAVWDQARRAGTCSASAVACCEKALEVCPPSSRIFREAAFVYALAAEDDPAFKRRALACLQKAVALGVDPKTFRSSPTLAVLRGEEEFQSLLRAAPGPKESGAVSHLIDPFE